MQAPLVTYDPPQIRFSPDEGAPVQAPLPRLRRFVVVTCFSPEVAPDPDPPTFDLLDFGESFWLVPDNSAERYLDTAWAAHLQACQGYFQANAGALPETWRRPYLLLWKNLYRPRAVVVPAQPTPFLDVTGPLDPARIGEANRRAYQALTGSGGSSQE